MPSPPLVSLLIPTFNSALTAADAIASCRGQTFCDLEIVIYDEVSKDSTRDIIQAAARQDPRIRFFSSDTNSGPVRAWRKLLREARGKYATFVWADDLILPRYVEALVEVLRQNPSHSSPVATPIPRRCPARLRIPARKMSAPARPAASCSTTFPPAKSKGTNTPWAS